MKGRKKKPKRRLTWGKGRRFITKIVGRQIGAGALWVARWLDMMHKAELERMFEKPPNPEQWVSYYKNHRKLRIAGCVQCGKCLKLKFCMSWRHRFFRRVIRDANSLRKIKPKASVKGSECERRKRA